MWFWALLAVAIGNFLIALTEFGDLPAWLHIVGGFFCIGCATFELLRKKS